MSERLQPGVHPDPDALSAFAENALPEHERVACLTHLADCAECREVVFLAQKGVEIEESAAAVAEAPVSFWRRFLRPAALVPVTALIVATLLFGLYRMTRSTQQQPTVTASAKAPVETAPTPRAEQTPEPQQAPKKRVQPPAPRHAEAPPAPEAAAPAPVEATANVATGGGVTGVIADPTGAIVASARVELKNEETGTTYISTSDATGKYSITELVPGRYDLSVSVPGFKKFVQAGIQVQPQQIARQDSALQVGAASESVTVSATALLKTESGGVSNNASISSLDNLPVLSAGSKSVGYPLPDKSAPASAAVKDKLVVAADSAGALLVSTNAGKSWTRVKAAWKGKVVRVVVKANGMFELTTDPISTWVSTDGRHWSENPTSR